MRVLHYLQKAWIAAAIVSFIVGVFNLISNEIFDNRVYFPVFCGIFCLLIWFNIRGQRRFRDKMIEEQKTKVIEKENERV